MQLRETTPILSSRVLGLPPSPIRALLDGRRTPHTVDLGGGHPEPSLFPHRELALAAERLLSQHGGHVLQYAPTEGIGELRAYVAERLRHRGHAVDAEQILITQGSQQALAVAATLLVSPGESALLEEPGYPGAVQAFALAEATLLGMPVTIDGWDWDAFPERTPKAIYVMAHHQNPTGRCASTSQRQHVAKLARERGTHVIEDDAYSELYFDRSLARPIVADCPERGLLIGSFSKTISPGLRLGYLAAPRHLVEPLVRILQTTTLQPGTFTQHLIVNLLQNFDYEAHLSRVNSLYETRARALSQCCDELGLALCPPRGGFFLWAKSAAPATPLCRQLAKRDLLVVPEAAFRLPGSFRADEHLRLAFCRFRGTPEETAKIREAWAGASVL